MRQELLSDSKEIVEHVLSVKAAVEELEQICSNDTVVVDDFMSIRERGKVQDLGSRATILDILASAPNHNIAFVFLTAMLSKTAAELTPIAKAELETLTSTASKRLSVIGRRSLSFRRMTGGGSNTAAAEAALARRRAKEKKFAEVMGRSVSRVTLPAKDKERKAVEVKLRGAVELFVRKSLQDL
ncbi:Salicylate synthase like protein [Verticillium longisporum]|nr:Salicylate synthase like protein [Verticillium longisporum]